MRFLFRRKQQETILFCPVCKRRFPREGFAFQGRECGICHGCAEKLSYTPEGGSFDGGQYLDYILSPFYYKDPVKALMLQYKFQHQWAYGELLADIAVRRLKAYPQLSEFDLIIPVPLSKQRVKERGYNQSVIFAKRFAAFLKQPAYSEALLRPVHTKRQSGLNARMRQLNVRDAFAADHETVREKSVLLVDDIFTTGSTMQACAKELRNQGSKQVAGLPVTLVEPGRERLLF